MKHLFLTGRVGVGKTTLLGRLLPPDTPLCGMVTERIQTPEGMGVYLHAPQTQRIYTELNRVGSWQEGEMRAYPEIFDTLGVRLLTRLPPEQILMMDELGFLEQEAARFCGRVLELLDGQHRIFGVVKDRPCPFLDAVRNHPNVEVIRVTPENREELYRELCKSV